jgi:hypothetical protein
MDDYAELELLRRASLKDAEAAITQAASVASKAETGADGGRRVAVVEIGDAGTVGNGNREATADVRVRNTGIGVEALGKMMVCIE